QSFCPLLAQPVEDRGREGEHVVSERGEANEPTARVAGIGGAFRVAEGDEAVDGFARGLFGDSEPAAVFAVGSSVGSDGMHGVTVGGSREGAASAGELVV